MRIVPVLAHPSEDGECLYGTGWRLGRDWHLGWCLYEEDEDERLVTLDEALRMVRATKRESTNGSADIAVGIGDGLGAR